MKAPVTEERVRLQKNLERLQRRVGVKAAAVVKKGRKVTVVYDDRVRSDTTGMYFKWGFERLGHEVTHVRPDEALTITKADQDLYVKIDDGLRIHNQWNPKLKPNAYYIIDTHYWDAAEWRPQISEQMEWSFVTQLTGIKFLEDNGVPGKATWLPLAADEDLHSPDVNGYNKYDWGFVGNVGHAQPGSPNKRIDYLDALLKAFPNGMISDYSFYKELANIYGSSKTVFNTCINNDISMRFFEGLMSGACLVTEYITDNGIKELHESGFGAPLHNTFCVYKDQEELIEVMTSVLSDPDKRKKYGREGRKMALAGHAYKHRCLSILNHFNL